MGWNRRNHRRKEKEGKAKIHVNRRCRGVDGTECQTCNEENEYMAVEGSGRQPSDQSQRKINITLITSLQTSPMLCPQWLSIFLRQRNVYIYILYNHLVRTKNVSQPHKLTLSFFSFAIHRPLICLICCNFFFFFIKLFQLQVGI